MQDEKSIQILLSLCTSLNQHHIQYLIVGGTAVNAHGYYRPTTERDGTVVDMPDFDFWFNPRYLNYQRLLDAFEDMGLDIGDAREEEFPFPKSSFFRFKLPGYSLDFLPKVGGDLKFDECYSRRSVSVIEEIEISVISLEDLILTKKAVGRKKDLEDILVLQNLHKNKP